MANKQKRIDFLKQFLAAFSLALLFAACSASQNQVTNPAPDASPVASSAATGGEATELVVYTALEDDQLAEYLPLFTQKHPDIKVNTVRDSTGIVTAKLLAEKDNPQADVVWGLAASSLLLADDAELLEPYAPAGLDRVEAKLRDSRTPPHWVGIDAWMSAFCVNTVELEKQGLTMPASWADLTKPEYKGKLVMPNPASSGTGYLSVSAILQVQGEEKGWEYLDALHENIAQYTHSGSKPCKMAGAGEYPIGISFGYRAVKQKNDGEPIAPVFPSEGSGWDIEANALIKKPEIKDASKTFLDWAISEDISKKYAENFAITAVKTDVPIPAGFPADPMAQLAKNDFAWSAQNRDRILAEWTKRYDSKSEPKS